MTISCIPGAESGRDGRYAETECVVAERVPAEADDLCTRHSPLGSLRPAFLCASVVASVKWASGFVWLLRGGLGRAQVKPFTVPGASEKQKDALVSGPTEGKRRLS